MAEKPEPFKIIWSFTARLQFKHVLEYWTVHNQSRSFSFKLQEQTFEKLELIAKNPAIFTKTTIQNTYQARVNHFAIIYEVNTDQIQILAFWDQRQDPEKLKSLLKSSE